MQQLSREYLRDHAEPSPQTDRVDDPGAFGETVVDIALRAAAEELAGPADTRDEIQTSVPVTIKPVENAGPLENCVEVCVGVGVLQVCYHRTFKGKYPGPDDRWPGGG